MSINLITILDDVLVKATDGREYILERGDSIELRPRTDSTNIKKGTSTSQRNIDFIETGHRFRAQSKNKKRNRNLN